MERWERLSQRLLEREFLAVQQAIRQEQIRHLENRNKFMQEVMTSHHQDMSRYALRKQTSVPEATEDVDNRFLTTYHRVIETLTLVVLEPVLFGSMYGSEKIYLQSK